LVNPVIEQANGRAADDNKTVTRASSRLDARHAHSVRTASFQRITLDQFRCGVLPFILRRHAHRMPCRVTSALAEVHHSKSRASRGTGFGEGAVADLRNCEKEGPWWTPRAGSFWSDKVYQGPAYYALRSGRAVMLARSRAWPRGFLQQLVEARPTAPFELGGASFRSVPGNVVSRSSRR
jgi:hypothetical protein